jgi:hypothetical protein
LENYCLSNKITNFLNTDRLKRGNLGFPIIKNSGFEQQQQQEQQHNQWQRQQQE